MEQKVYDSDATADACKLYSPGIEFRYGVDENDVHIYEDTVKQATEIARLTEHVERVEQQLDELETQEYGDGDPGQELDRLARNYEHEHCCGYEEALCRVMTLPANANLVAAYSSPTYTAQPVPYPKRSAPQPTSEHTEMSQKLDRVVKTQMQLRSCDYATALKQVLSENPDIKAWYSGVWTDE